MAKFLKIQTKGFDTVQNQLKRMLETGVMKPAQQSILQSSDDIAFVAKEMAPRKTGTLESAIEPLPSVSRSGYVITGGVHVRDDLYNDVDQKRTSQYMTEAHEKITPAGNKRLGPGSVQKNATVLEKYDGVGVGGWFMDRAFKFMKEKVITQLQNAIKAGLSRS